MAKDLSVVDLAITVGRRQTKQNSIDITGNACSDCICRNHNFLEPVSAQAQSCIDRWDQILTAIRSASEIDLTFMETDLGGRLI